MAKITAARWAELSPRLDELLTLPPPERSRWLDALAANDPATAGELRELLAVHESASRHAFLGGVADQALLSSRVVAGQRLGAWELVEPIGEGGMGSVWRARRSDGRFEGEAAIKLLRSGLFDAALQERFRREGAILARLHHPGIAQLLDAGISEHGQPYLVIELVRGERIDHWCNARGLGVRARIELFCQVLDAVAAAHAQLVIHREPSNILVDEAGRVKLLDFGIARLLGDEAAPGLTREGTFALTPDYAAPEQFTGGVLGTATDVYALGVVLFELLAGVNPRGVSTADGPMAHMRAALEGSDARASAVAPIDRRRALGGDLDNVLAKALRKDPAARYATASAFADDLRAYLAHRPVSARPDALGYRLAKFVQRNRLGVALGVAAAMVAVLGVASTLWQAHRAGEEADRARAAAVRAEHERDRIALELDFSEASGRLLYQLIGEAGDKPLTASEMLQRAVGFIDKQYASAPEQQARLLSEVAYQLTEMGKHAEARPLLDRAREIFVKRNDVASLAVLDCQTALVNAYDKKPAELRAIMDKGIAVLLAQDDHTDASVANCLTGRSHLRRLEGDLPGALADADHALAWFGGEPRPAQRLSTMSARAARATALGGLGRWAEGAADYRRILAELKATGEAETNKAAIYTSNLGALLDQGGQTRESANAYRQAIDLRSREGMEESPNSLGRLADLQARLGADDASALADHAIAAAAKGGGPRLTGAVTMSAARAACEQAAWERCAARLADAWKLLQPLVTPSSPLRGDYEWLTAWLAVEQGPAPASVESLEARLARVPAAEQGGAEIRPWLLVARVHRQAGQFDAARAALQRATALADRLKQSGYPASEFEGRCQLEQAQLDQALGQAAQARDAARDAAAQLQAVMSAQAPATQSATLLASSH
jgi:eukaryotic-like serine/threonine-protein kinase